MHDNREGTQNKLENKALSLDVKSQNRCSWSVNVIGSIEAQQQILLCKIIVVIRIAYLVDDIIAAVPSIDVRSQVGPPHQEEQQVDIICCIRYPQLARFMAPSSSLHPAARSVS